MDGSPQRDRTTDIGTTGHARELSFEGALLGPHRKGPWVNEDEHLAALRAAPKDPTFFADIADMASGSLDLDGRWQR